MCPAAAAAAIEFVCNNFWQSIAQHHVDLPHETAHLYTPAPFSPGDVRPGDRVFVKTDLLDLFVRLLLPRIGAPFVLITGHSDLTPGVAAAEKIERHPLITAWFAVNVSAPLGPKTVALPLGLSEPDRPIGDQRVVRRCMAASAAAASAAAASSARKVFFPATGATHPMRAALTGLRHPALVPATGSLGYEEYLTELGRHAYALCPRGNGIDVHRVYEAVLMRTVPIVFTDVVPAAFERFPGLPVLIAHTMAELEGILDAISAGFDPAADVDWPAVQACCLTARVRDVYGM